MAFDLRHFLAVQSFSSNRLEFYEDLAQTLDDQGNPKDFIAGRLNRAKQKKQTGVAQLYQKIYQDLGVKTISESIRHAVPQSDMVILGASETAGKTVEGLRFLVQKITTEAEMKRAALGAALMPFFLITAMFGVYAWVGFQFIPLLETMYPHEYWSPMGQVFYTLSYSARVYGIPIYGVFVASFMAFLWSLPNWGNASIRPVLDRYPPYNIYRQMQAASFLVLLASLMESGVSLRDAIERIQKQSAPYLRFRLQIILHYLTKSPDFPGDAMEQSQLFEEKTAIRLAEYGRRVGFDNAAKKIGATVINATILVVRGQTKVVNTVGLLVVGMAIGFAFLNILSIPNEATEYLRTKQ